MTVSMPDKCHGSIAAQCLISGHITAGAVTYKFAGRVIASQLAARLERDTSGSITATSPATLAAGDVIFVTGMYVR